MNTPFILRMTHLFKSIVALAAISLLAACGGGDSSPAAANPTGYYTGTAAVVDGSSATVNISDLQALVDNDNHRFMVMSEAEELLYDGTITSINGNDFSATVKVYKDGTLVTGSPTSFTGRITQGSQITGTFSGTGTWNGTFTLVYSQSNNVAASLVSVASGVDEFWGGQDLTYDSTDPQFRLSTEGAVIQVDAVGGGVMRICGFYGGSIVPVANTRLYRLTVNVDICSNSAVEGTYTGLATTKDDDDTMVMMIGLGNYANASDYIRRSPLPVN